VKEKAKAKQKYEDAIAKGNQAVLLKETKAKDVLNLSLGNLLPAQAAKITIVMVQSLGIVADTFCFKFPMTFIPRYKALDEGSCDFSVAFKLQISSQRKICYVSLPEESVVDFTE